MGRTFYTLHLVKHWLIQIDLAQNPYSLRVLPLKLQKSRKLEVLSKQFLAFRDPFGTSDKKLDFQSVMGLYPKIAFHGIFFRNSYTSHKELEISNYWRFKWNIGTEAFKISEIRRYCYIPKKLEKTIFHWILFARSLTKNRTCQIIADLVENYGQNIQNSENPEKTLFGTKKGTQIEYFFRGAKLSTKNRIF